MSTEDDAGLGLRLAKEVSDKLYGQSPIVAIIIMGALVKATETALRAAGKVPNRSRILRHISQCADGVDVRVEKPQ